MKKKLYFEIYDKENPSSSQFGEIDSINSAREVFSGRRMILGFCFEFFSKASELKLDYTFGDLDIKLSSSPIYQ